MVNTWGLDRREEGIGRRGWKLLTVFKVKDYSALNYKVNWRWDGNEHVQDMFWSLEAGRPYLRVKPKDKFEFSKEMVSRCFKQKKHHVQRVRDREKMKYLRTWKKLNVPIVWKEEWQRVKREMQAEARLYRTMLRDLDSVCVWSF